MREENAITMRWLIKGRGCLLEPTIETALEAYVNGTPLTPEMTACLWQMVHLAEAVQRFLAPSPLPCR